MPARWAIVPFGQIESYFPKNGLIIDIGCGEGVLATLLAISSKKRKVEGYDINQDKINLGQSIAQRIPNLSFQRKNVLKENLPKAAGFVLSDFLHHIPEEQHKSLLKRIVEATDKNGIIVIKEIDLADGIRSKISRFFDFLFYPGQNVSFINSQDLANFLKSLGLKVDLIKTQKWFPGSTTLFICRR